MPPVWLCGFLALAWWQSSALPMGSFGPLIGDFLGGLLVGGGLILMALAVFEMRRHRTTIIPHRSAERLVTSGIFKRSRNPIYLGDVMVLTGLILAWDAALSLPLIPVLVWILEKRFILPEEIRLERKFVADFRRYAQQTGRWL